MSMLLRLLAYAWRAKIVVGKRISPRARRAARQRSTFYRDAWCEAAEELGATFQIMSKDEYEIGVRGARLRVKNNFTPLDGLDQIRQVNDKPRVHAILSSGGLPVPPYQEFCLRRRQLAREFMLRNGRCVVKPAVGTGAGAGVTTGVANTSHLYVASLRAAGFGPRMLIEPQLKGEVVRLLFLDGMLLDAVKRSPPAVIGDGSSRVSQLVRRLNAKRRRAGYRLATVMLVHDLEMRRTLENQGLSWQSVPEPGQRVVLKHVINDNSAEDNESVRDIVAAEVVKAGQRAADLMGLRLAGVDLITPDVRRDLESVGGVILEVNANPGYQYHYFTRSGGRRVAVDVLRACLASPTGGDRQAAVTSGTASSAGTC